MAADRGGRGAARRLCRLGIPMRQTRHATGRRPVALPGPLLLAGLSAEPDVLRRIHLDLLHHHALPAERTALLRPAGGTRHHTFRTGRGRRGEPRRPNGRPIRAPPRRDRSDHGGRGAGGHRARRASGAGAGRGVGDGGPTAPGRSGQRPGHRPEPDTDPLPSTGGQGGEQPAEPSRPASASGRRSGSPRSARCSSPNWAATGGPLRTTAGSSSRSPSSWPLCSSGWQMCAGSAAAGVVHTGPSAVRPWGERHEGERDERDHQRRDR